MWTLFNDLVLCKSSERLVTVLWGVTPSIHCLLSCHLCVHSWLCQSRTRIMEGNRDVQRDLDCCLSLWHKRMKNTRQREWHDLLFMLLTQIQLYSSVKLVVRTRQQMHLPFKPRMKHWNCMSTNYFLYSFRSHESVSHVFLSFLPLQSCSFPFTFTEQQQETSVIFLWIRRGLQDDVNVDAVTLYRSSV